MLPNKRKHISKNQLQANAGPSGFQHKRFSGQWLELDKATRQWSGPGSTGVEATEQDY